uniref:Multipolar spindle 1 n=1 Tax=Kalanchoe fedtschenkoi TaxID=63787 RepID=A0A7N0US47_KALFE
MSSSGGQSQQAGGGGVSADSDQSLKLAVAVALLRNNLVRKGAPGSESDAERWRKKAKERKQELLKLREELRATEEGMQDDLFPQNVACKCYFFSDVGTSDSKHLCDSLDGKVNDVLRRRFLRQVRLKERRKKQAGGSVQQLYISDFSKEDKMEQFKASVDFLAELCEKVVPEDEVRFANWSHQAIEFILDSLKNMQLEENSEAFEGTVTSLVMRLIRRMTTSRQSDEKHSGGDSQLYIQHLIRKLGSNPYVGQRVLLSVSQRICALAENLLFVDPFDTAFSNMHDSMFVMIQLIEFLILDYLFSWPSEQGFENSLFQEWTTSIVHARKGLELLETRNGLYILYLDRVIGQLVKAVTEVPSLQKLNPDVFDKLLS